MGVKISNLPPVVTPALTDTFPSNQSTTTYKETLQQVMDLFEANIQIPYTQVSGLSANYLQVSAIGVTVQGYSTKLSALSAEIWANNQITYQTGLSTVASTPLTAFGRTLIDDNDAPTARNTLGLGTAATQNTSAFLQPGNNLSDVSSAATARTNLGLAIGTNVQAWSAKLDSLAGQTWAADQITYQTGTSTIGLTTLSSYARTLIDDTTAENARGTLLVPNNTGQNVIIGGDFGTNPWQRGTTFTSAANGAFTADRFNYNFSGTGVVDILKTSDSPTLSQAGYYTTSCLHVDVTTADISIAAGDLYLVRYKVEGYDIASFGFGQSNARTLTLSFWHKHTKTGTYCVSFRNNAADRSYIAEYTQSVTDTWEKATITITADVSGTWLYTNGIGLFIEFSLSIGSTFQTTANSWNSGSFFATSNQVNALDSSSNNFKLSLIKLEAGSVSTPFSIELESQTLLKCQRYYSKTYTQGVNPATNTGTDSAGGIQFRMANLTSAQTPLRITWQFPVTMRTAPTMTGYSTDGTSGSWRDRIANANVALNNILGIGTNSAVVDLTTGVSTSVLVEGHLVANAEL